MRRVVSLSKCATKRHSMITGGSYAFSTTPTRLLHRDENNAGAPPLSALIASFREMAESGGVKNTEPASNRGQNNPTTVAAHTQPSSSTFMKMPFDTRLVKVIREYSQYTDRMVSHKLLTTVRESEESVAACFVMYCRIVFNIHQNRLDSVPQGELMEHQDADNSGNPLQLRFGDVQSVANFYEKSPMTDAAGQLGFWTSHIGSKMAVEALFQDPSNKDEFFEDYPTEAERENAIETLCNGELSSQGDVATHWMGVLQRKMSQRLAAVAPFLSGKQAVDIFHGMHIMGTAYHRDLLTTVVDVAVSQLETLSASNLCLLVETLAAEYRIARRSSVAKKRMQHNDGARFEVRGGDSDVGILSTLYLDLDAQLTQRLRKHPELVTSTNALWLITSLSDLPPISSELLAAMQPLLDRVLQLKSVRSLCTVGRFFTTSEQSIPSREIISSYLSVLNSVLADLDTLSLYDTTIILRFLRRICSNIHTRSSLGSLDVDNVAMVAMLKKVFALASNKVTYSSLALEHTDKLKMAAFVQVKNYLFLREMEKGTTSKQRNAVLSSANDSDAISDESDLPPILVMVALRVLPECTQELDIALITELSKAQILHYNSRNGTVRLRNGIEKYVKGDSGYNAAGIQKAVAKLQLPSSFDERRDVIDEDVLVGEPSRPHRQRQVPSRGPVGRRGHQSHHPQQQHQRTSPPNPAPRGIMPQRPPKKQYLWQKEKSTAAEPRSPSTPPRSSPSTSPSAEPTSTSTSSTNKQGSRPKRMATSVHLKARVPLGFKLLSVPHPNGTEGAHAMRILSVKPDTPAVSALKTLFLPDLDPSIPITAVLPMLEMTLKSKGIVVLEALNGRRINTIGDAAAVMKTVHDTIGAKASNKDGDEAAVDVRIAIYKKQ